MHLTDCAINLICATAHHWKIPLSDRPHQTTPAAYKTQLREHQPHSSMAATVAAFSVAPLRRRPTSAAISDNPTASPAPPPTLPLRKIPGGYGLPLLGPIRDRFAYFYTQGRDEFLRSRVRLHQSTVFRTNVPPGPFISPDPRVIVLLDAVSFPTLFDLSLVDKRDLFTGTYTPSLSLTGGHRVLSYLDANEPHHAPLKRLLFSLLASRRHALIPEFRRTAAQLFTELESQLKKSGKTEFGPVAEQSAFDFLIMALFNTDPKSTKLGTDGPSLITKWVLFQLGPILTLGLPNYLEDLLLHSFRLPPALVKGDYARICEFFSSAAAETLDEAERMGLDRDEALHNIVFAVCFNSWGGMKILFPSLLKWVGKAGAVAHGRLAEEVRAAVRDVGDGEVTMRAVEAMPLLKSAVYEVLRVEPPVPLQFGRARKDIVVQSHDSAFEVRAGEMMFGYQPFATKDPRVFERAEEFVVDRFVGEGERLLKYVVWSNGPETEAATLENKQCAGKDFVVLVARLLLVELFLRYDSFDIEIAASALGSSVKITSLKRASF